MVERIVNFTRRTSENILLHPFGSSVSLAALTICLLFLGMIFFLFRSMTTILPLWITDSKAVVYLHSQTSAEDQENLERQIRQLPKVEEIRSVSREEARKLLEAQLGDLKGILAGIEGNLLPPSLEITFEANEKHPEEIEALVGKIREFPQVEDVFYGKSPLEKLEFLPMASNLMGSWFPGLLALIVVLVVSNSIKHTVSARRDELEIYDVMGATPFFARAPFYLEAILLGAVSGIIASSVLVLLIKVSRKVLPVPLGSVFSWAAWELACLAGGIFLCGVVLGWLGSWFALRRIESTTVNP